MKWISRLACVLGLFLCSCAMFDRRATGLQTSLVNLSLGEATLWETSANFTVRIENEMPEPVQLRGAVHKIYVNGLYIGQGMSDQTTEVPRFGSTTQTFTAHLRNLALATRVRAMIDSRRFEYRISSTLYTAPNNRRLRLSNMGELDLHDFQPAR